MAYTTIDDPGLFFNTVTWTGNDNESRDIDGVGFQPDWVWVKNRDSSDFNHVLANSVIGLNTFNNSDTTAAQLTNHAAGFISSANSDGFVITAGSSNLSNYDTGSNKQVAWNWKAGTSFSNDASATSIGSIDSSGSVSTISGFAIITYNSLRTGSIVQTFAHGLGVAPDFLIFKNLTETQNWLVWSKEIPTNQHLNLNNTNTLQTDAGSMNNTAPTSTVVTIGADGRTNSTTDGKAHICYAFKEIQGFSAVGKYIGNGSSDGSFIYTGFKPAFILVKNSSTGSYKWIIQDNKRNLFNPRDKYIYPNESEAEAESSNFNLDFYSNGFKSRNTRSETNDNNNEYIYLAIAESPQVNSKGVPNNAE